MVKEKAAAEIVEEGWMYIWAARPKTLHLLPEARLQRAWELRWNLPSKVYLGN